MVRTTMPSASACQRMMSVGCVSVMAAVAPGQAGRLEAFEDGGDAHAAADAQGDERPPRGAALELVDDGGDEHRAGGAERMAHRDRAAVDVDVLLGQVQVLDPLQDHRGERLVELEQVDVVKREAGGG